MNRFFKFLTVAITVCLCLSFIAPCVYAVDSSSDTDVASIKYGLSYNQLIYFGVAYDLVFTDIPASYEPYFVFSRPDRIVLVWVYQSDIFLGKSYVGFDGTVYYYTDNPLWMSEFTINTDGSLVFSQNRLYGSQFYGSPSTSDLGVFRSRFLCSRYDVYWGGSVSASGEIFFPATPQILFGIDIQQGTVVTLPAEQYNTMVSLLTYIAGFLLFLCVVVLCLFGYKLFTIFF